MVDQKIVIAHVYGHTDFFKNNYWFSATNRKMMDGMANHGTIIRRYGEKYGYEEVENFVDVGTSIDDLIDFHSLFIRRPSPSRVVEPEGEEENGNGNVTNIKLRSKDYMDGFVNPPEFVEEQMKKITDKRAERDKFPEHQEKDIMLFLIDNAPLENWQKVILSILRDESYYFAPQRVTKIMNEGWASYWHSTIMTEKCLKDSELIDYADHHSGTMGSRPGSINPYKLGIELYKDIEDRWNKGKFGKEWDECDDLDEKKSWDKHLGLGRQKIFEVRRVANDITFIDNYLTKEFCERHKLFTYKFNDVTGMYEISDRDFRAIKAKLLFSLTNFGQPVIHVEDANFKNRGELYLIHKHEGIDLDIGYARDTLQNIFKIWRRSVHLETKINDRGKLFTFDGKDHIELNISGN
jgi:stage V sporulation protein R